MQTAVNTAVMYVNGFQRVLHWGPVLTYKSIKLENSVNLEVYSFEVLKHSHETVLVVLFALFRSKHYKKDKCISIQRVKWNQETLRLISVK